MKNIESENTGKPKRLRNPMNLSDETYGMIDMIAKARNMNLVGVVKEAVTPLYLQLLDGSGKEPEGLKEIRLCMDRLRDLIVLEARTQDEKLKAYENALHDEKLRFTAVLAAAAEASAHAKIETDSAIQERDGAISKQKQTEEQLLKASGALQYVTDELYATKQELSALKAKKARVRRPQRNPADTGAKGRGAGLNIS